jgi:DNA-binding beta-propeller fold protein YncE
MDIERMKPAHLMLFPILLLTLGAAEQPATKPSAYLSDPTFPQLPPGMKLAAVSGVALDRKGDVFVFHRGDPPILVFDSAGKHLRSIGKAGQFAMAHGIRFDNDGNLWTTDSANHTVQKFSPDGTLLLTLGVRNKPANDETHFNRPTDIAFAANGDFFVADGYGNSRVVKFDKDGRFLLAWGKKGRGDGEFNLPHAIRIDAKGNVYVGDRENNRIQVFDANRKFIRKIEGFAPYGLFITSEDILFVADGRANRILKMTSDGKLLASWGEKGSGPGQFEMPHAIAAGADGAIYVTEINGKRIQKYVLARN